MKEKIFSKVSQLKGDQNLLEVLKGSGLVMIFKIFGGFSFYLFMLVVGRFYGPASLGIYEVAATVLMIGGTVARLGYEGVWVRFFPVFQSQNEPEKFRGLVRRSSKVVGIFSVVLGVVIFVFAESLAGFFSSPNMKFPFQIAGIILPLYAIITLLSEGFRSMKNMRAFAIYQNGTFLLFVTVILYFLPKLGYQQDWVPVLVYGFVLLIFLAVILRKFQQKMRGLSADINRKDLDMRSMLKIATPIMFSGALFYIINWTDTLMVQYFLNEHQVGIYQSAFRWATLVVYAQFAINSMVVPVMSQHFAEENFEGFRKVIRQVGVLNFVISVPIFFVLFFFPEFILNLVGKEFTEGVAVLQILAVAQLVNALSGPNLFALNITGKEKVAQRIMIFVAIFNFGANMFFIPKYGILGAGLASAISMALWNVLATFFVYRFYKVITVSFLDYLRYGR